MMKKLFILPVVLLPFCCFAQTANLNADLLRLSYQSDSLTYKRPVEKIFMQFDKPYYATGDTIWFKAYLFNSYLNSSKQSAFLNIDIANDSNIVVKQYRLPVLNGVSWGDIRLDESSFSSGTYTIRAYTNWMRNFGEDYFFFKSFYVTGRYENTWLVNKRDTTSFANGVTTENVKLQFSDINKKLFLLGALHLQVVTDNKHLYKQKSQTDLQGSINLSFNVPPKISALAIIAESGQTDDNRKAVIPITFSRAENIDVQFFPEGGDLVAGLSANIGFKAIGEDGKGVNISGIITDRENKKIAEFQSLHNGMGSFNMATRIGETYTAKVTLPNGVIKEYPFPVVKDNGTILQIKNPMESDSLELIVGASNDIVNCGEGYFLTGKARGIICYAAIIRFQEGQYVKRKIAKALFPTGITHFTIMSAKYQPLNERMVFIDRNDYLNIQINKDKPFYNPRDSVALQIKVTGKNGSPVAGYFSLAVTDCGQVKIDSLNNDNILVNTLLTSGLKGYVDAPGYYFSTKNEKAGQALDNLMLTQGWIGCNWQETLSPRAIANEPEKEFLVKGSVLNVFNKPVKGTDILLLSKSPSLFMDTITDKEGRFVFNHFPRIDTPLFVLKAVNKNGKSFNVLIKMDDIDHPVFTKPLAPVNSPWYVNSDNTLLNYAKNNSAIKLHENFPAGGIKLKEVKITEKKIIHGSQNLNGPGNADFVLDEKDLEAEGKKTWLEFLENKIPGFKGGEVKKSWFFIQDIHNPIIIDRGMAISRSHEWYFINDKPIKFYVDGISVTEYNPTPISEVLSYSGGFINITNFLKGNSIEDIKGIEVNFSGKYTAAYTANYIATDPKTAISPDDAAFIEITTRSGHGPIIDNTPGVYLFTPLPISWPKQFYKPKYTVKDTAKNNFDLRSTIDWEPNIVTDANGEAKVWFYTAGTPSTYTVTIEGADMKGSLGFKTGKITVGANKEKAK